MSDWQVYNLLAGLAVVVILFGGLGVYGLWKDAKNAEAKQQKGGLS